MINHIQEVHHSL